MSRIETAGRKDTSMDLPALFSKSENFVGRGTLAYAPPPF